MLKYIAGFFDGEGSLCGHHKQRKRRGKTQHSYWTLSIANTNLEVLKFIRSFLKMGSIYARKPRIRRLGKKKQFYYRVHGRDNLLRILPKLLPHLIVKREKTKEAIKDLKERPYA